MIIRAGWGFQEAHDGTVGTMDAKGGLGGGVHGDTTEFSDGRKGQNVGEGFWVIPDRTKIFDIANLGGYLVTTIGGHSHV